MHTVFLEQSIQRIRLFRSHQAGQFLNCRSRIAFRFSDVIVVKKSL